MCAELRAEGIIDTEHACTTNLEFVKPIYQNAAVNTAVELLLKGAKYKPSDESQKFDPVESLRPLAFKYAKRYKIHHSAFFPIIEKWGAAIMIVTNIIMKENKPIINPPLIFDDVTKQGLKIIGGDYMNTPVDKQTDAVSFTCAKYGAQVLEHNFTTSEQYQDTGETFEEVMIKHRDIHRKWGIPVPNRPFTNLTQHPVSPTKSSACHRARLFY